MKRILLSIALILPFTIFGQDCDCMSTFEWVKNTIETNDAGFQYIINAKGENAYELHNKMFAEKITKLNNIDECEQTISQWMTFFRSGHLEIRRISQEQLSSENKLSEQEIIDSFKDWEKTDVNLEEFKNQLKEKDENDLEGIWVNGNYKIGIKKAETGYLGFIIEADGVYWTKGQIKFRIKEDLSATYYMRDHSAENFESINLLDRNYLEIGSSILERVFPKPVTIPTLQVERYLKAIDAENPYFEKINKNTTYIRIPRFWGAGVKSKIDSIINTNKETILKSGNLIIDLRNNGGGSDACFQELLPILYTNTIRTVGVDYLSTPLNNQFMLDLINNEEYGLDEKGKKWAQGYYDELSKHIGEFVLFSDSSITEQSFDIIHELPKNIGIIINEKNGSTTEQFIIAAKQSKKVKLFGTTTAGVLDISNMYFVKSPCGKLELGYCLTKSRRIPGMAIDEKGIQPDYYIDKEIPKYEWINFVSEILNK